MTAALITSYSSSAALALVAPSLPEERITRLQAKALSCKAVKELYDEACKNGAWSIKLAKTKSGFLAETRWKERTICIDPTLSDDKALSYFIFELANATNREAFSQLTSLARENRIEREDFAIGNEGIEHSSCLRHRGVIGKAIADSNWDPNMHLYEHPLYDSFESYWSYVKDSPHADYWRASYDRLAPIVITPELDTLVRSEINRQSQEMLPLAAAFEIDPAVLAGLQTPVFAADEAEVIITPELHAQVLGEINRRSNDGN